MADVKQQVGQLIRDTRKAKGLTQKELSQKLGIDEWRISKYESGKLNPTIETLQSLFDVMGVTIRVVTEE